VNRIGVVALAGYVATILAANWAIGHVGTCQEGGPCTIGVGFGLSAPSGVLFVGLALFLRDVVQDALGRRWVAGAIVLGAALSWWVSAPFVALASGVAFLLSEVADAVVYTPLRREHQPVAVLLSGVVGGLVDSAVFLWLAFGSLAFLAGQFVGKTELALLCALIVWAGRTRRVLSWPRRNEREPERT
jgi:uncharacterized PurR-regulated membrane protein YhhQ (DUF165 family)